MPRLRLLDLRDVGWLALHSPRVISDTHTEIVVEVFGVDERRGCSICAIDVDGTPRPRMLHPHEESEIVSARCGSRG